MSFFKKIKISKTNGGMTYVEVIVVLSIFAVMSSVALFNYGDFQDAIEIRNLASEVGLKFVEAQKSAVAGKWHDSAAEGWKPSYGMYLEKKFGTSNGKTFYYFADLNSLGDFDPTVLCTASSECIGITQIGKSGFIESVSLSGTACPSDITSLTVTFTRPNLTPTFVTNPPSACSPTSAQVLLNSGKGETATIEIQASGRIEIN